MNRWTVGSSGTERRHSKGCKLRCPEHLSCPRPTPYMSSLHPLEQHLEVGCKPIFQRRKWRLSREKCFFVFFVLFCFVLFCFFQLLQPGRGRAASENQSCLPLRAGLQAECTWPVHDVHSSKGPTVPQECELRAAGLSTLVR